MRRFFLLGLLLLVAIPVAARGQYVKGRATWPAYIEAVSRNDTSILNFGCGSLYRTMNERFSDLGFGGCNDLVAHMRTLTQVPCPKEKQYVARIVDHRVVNSLDWGVFAGMNCRKNPQNNRIEFAENGVLLVDVPRTAVPSQNVPLAKEPPAPAPAVNTIHDTVPDIRYVHDTVPKIVTKHDTITVSEGKSCWRSFSWCTVGAAAAFLAAGTYGWVKVCQNPPNKHLAMCGSRDEVNVITNIDNTSRSRTRGFTLGFSIPLRP